MSLLEDVFLEDEAGEAQELERIIEGDEYDERPRPISPDSDDNSEKDDEAEEDKRHVDPKSDKPKRIVKNPRVVLNPARLTGPRGIQVIPEHFKDFKFKGKGHEKEDLDLVLKKLEHWAYRLFPKFEFADCLKKIETLGKKRPVMVHLTKIRSDQFMSEETVVQRDSSDDEVTPEPAPVDEFDKLLQQQIELARATPAPGSVRKPAFSTPTMVDITKTMTKATSSPSINDEQRERMLRNRQMAEEKRLARLKQNTSQTNEHDSTNYVAKDSHITENDTGKETLVGRNTIPNKGNVNLDQTIEEHEVMNVKDVNSDQIADDDEVMIVKNNRSNVIDSSDEDDALVINESVSVDVHNSHRNDDGIDLDKEKCSVDVNGSKNTDSKVNGEAGDENDVMNDIEVEIQSNPEQNEEENDERIEEVDFDVSEKHSNDDKEVMDTENENSGVLKSNDADSDNVIFEKPDAVNSSINISSQVEDNQNKMGDQHNNKTDNMQDGKDGNKETVGDNELDIMDVDFSDDF